MRTMISIPGYRGRYALDFISHVAFVPGYRSNSRWYYDPDKVSKKYDSVYIRYPSFICFVNPLMERLGWNYRMKGKVYRTHYHKAQVLVRVLGVEDPLEVKFRNDREAREYAKELTERVEARRTETGWGINLQ